MEKIPFTQDVDLTEHVARFESEEKCREYLELLRWPDGVRCPRCDATRGISRLRQRQQFECDSCGYQFSVRVGTVFHNSHLPLWKWFLAVYVMGTSKAGVPANQLKRMLGVSYKTAWYLCHRIRTAMKDEALQTRRGRGPVDADAEIAGPYHHLSEKHLQAYLDEMSFRDKNRRNAHLFRDTLLRLIGSGSKPYAELIAGG